MVGASECSLYPSYYISALTGSVFHVHHARLLHKKCCTSLSCAAIVYASELALFVERLEALSTFSFHHHTELFECALRPSQPSIRHFMLEKSRTAHGDPAQSCHCKTCMSTLLYFPGLVSLNIHKMKTATSSFSVWKILFAMQ